MTIPASLFVVGLWACYVATGGGAVWLLAVLIRDWRGRTLW